MSQPLELGLGKLQNCLQSPSAQKSTLSGFCFVLFIISAVSFWERMREILLFYILELFIFAVIQVYLQLPRSKLFKNWYRSSYPCFL